MSHKLSLLVALAGTCFTMVGCGTNTAENPNGLEVSKLVVGLECNYAPFNWTETSSSEFTLPISNVAKSYADGYDIQIAKILGEQLDMEVEIVKEDWEALVPDVQLDAVNVIIAGMTDTEDRRQSINFTDEYYRSELVLVTSKTFADEHTSVLTSAELTTLLKGQDIVSQTNTVTNNVIDIFVEKFGAIHNAPVDSFAAAAVDVSLGGAFAMTAELPVAQSIVNSNADLGLVRIEQSILGDSLAELGVSIGVKKQNTKLLTALNEALATVTADERNTMMIDAVTRSTAAE